MTFDRGAEFAQLVKRILTETRNGIQETAAAFNMQYHTFYSRLSDGRVMFSADEIRALIRFTKRREIVDYLLEESSFIAIERLGHTPRQDDISARHATHQQVRHGAHTNVYVAAEILREVDQALLDDKIDHRDREKILEDVHQAEVALASLRSHLNKPIKKDEP